MLVHQRNPVGVELFSYVKTFIGFMLHISCIGFCRRKEGTQHAAKLQISVRTKSHINFMTTCLQGFLNTINTDFEH